MHPYNFFVTIRPHKLKPPLTLSFLCHIGYHNTPLSQQIGNTTVSKFFTDKSGAAPSDLASEESSSVPPPRRPTLLQRLHLGSSSSNKKPKPPTLVIRPSTSSSLPVQAAHPVSQPRLATSHSDAADVEEISQIMQSSLSLSSTPPQSSNKRQRSRDSRKNASQHTSAGQNGSEPDVQDRLARNGVRMPAYLSKSKTGKTHCALLQICSARITTTRVADHYSRNPSRFPRFGMETEVQAILWLEQSELAFPSRQVLTDSTLAQSIRQHSTLGHISGQAANTHRRLRLHQRLTHQPQIRPKKDPTARAIRLVKAQSRLFTDTRIRRD